MTRKTFDDITEKNISKFRAVISGKIGVCGSISTLKAFDSKIVSRFFDKETLSPIE